jgi:hypothetical protein
MDLEERNKIFIIDEILAKNKANIENDWRISRVENGMRKNKMCQNGKKSQWRRVI